MEGHETRDKQVQPPTSFFVKSNAESGETGGVYYVDMGILELNKCPICSNEEMVFVDEVIKLGEESLEIRHCNYCGLALIDYAKFKKMVDDTNDRIDELETECEELRNENESLELTIKNMPVPSDVEVEPSFEPSFPKISK